jgi:hypothetical protein
MAVRLFCQSPSELLNNIKARINDGSIDTWMIDADGDFTHSPEQWRKRAWLRPIVHQDKVVFRILAPRGTVMSKAVYGVYHGRFIEMLLTHFDTKFDQVTATAMPADGDIVRTVQS